MLCPSGFNYIDCEEYSLDICISLKQVKVYIVALVFGSYIILPVVDIDYVWLLILKQTTFRLAMEKLPDFRKCNQFSNLILGVFE